MKKSGKHTQQKKKGYGFAISCFTVSAVLILGSIIFLIYHYEIEPRQSEASPSADTVQSALPQDTPANSSIPEAAVSPETSDAQQGQTEESADMTALQNQITEYLADFDSKWCVQVVKLSTGESISASKNVEKDSPMVAASLIKLYIMGAVYERILAGEISEKDVSDKLTKMITISDNASANELTKLLGAGDAKTGMAAVNSFAASIGCSSTTMNRLMLDDNGLQNYTTAKDCALLLEMIYNGTCVSKDYSKKMLGLLSAQTKTNKIPAGVPTGVKVANKTGELTGESECDVAIVFGSKVDYVLCVISEPVSNANAIKAIKDISAMVYASVEQ